MLYIMICNTYIKTYIYIYIHYIKYEEMNMQVHSAMSRVTGLRSQIEKQLLASPEADPELEKKLEQTLQEIETHLIEPLSRRLEACSYLIFYSCFQENMYKRRVCIYISII